MVRLDDLEMLKASHVSAPASQGHLHQQFQWVGAEGTEGGDPLGSSGSGLVAQADSRANVSIGLWTHNN